MWRERASSEGVYSDIYDGVVWKNFLAPNGNPFLAFPGNYAFQLNVDWFNPFKHTKYSEGAIYLSVLNLPRAERYLQDNIILVGVIPGPKEPSLHMNSFLTPLVEDLKSLWSGIVLQKTADSSLLVRAALICSTCDIPAGRKVCGFVGHGAVKGCTKCLLTFPTKTFGEKADYSDFDKSHWIPRSFQEHRRVAIQYVQCKTHSAQKNIERDFGVRYSIL